MERFGKILDILFPFHQLKNAAKAIIVHFSSKKQVFCKI